MHLLVPILGPELIMQWFCLRLIIRWFLLLQFRFLLLQLRSLPKMPHYRPRRHDPAAGHVVQVARGARSCIAAMTRIIITAGRAQKARATNATIAKSGMLR